MICKTKRLYLRELEQDDFRDLAEILQDPEVVYAYEHHFSDNDVQEWLDRQFMRYAKYGYGLWAIVLQTTGEMIGQAGLTMQPYQNQDILEVGYLLKKRFWHNGYALEAVHECIQYAFHTLNQNKVYAIIKADNEPSIQVAKRLGMKKEDYIKINQKVVEGCSLTLVNLENGKYDLEFYNQHDYLPHVMNTSFAK